MRDAVARSERELIARYNVTIKAYPQLAQTLTPLRDQHSEHLAAMANGDSPSSTPTPVPSPPASAKRAVTDLTNAERAASNQRADSSLVSTDRNLIWTLSLIAASEQQHATVLAAVKV